MTFWYGCLNEGVLNFREIFIQIVKKINDLTTFGVHLDVHIDYFIADVLLLLLQSKIFLSLSTSLIYLYNNHVNHSYYEQPTTYQ